MADLEKLHLRSDGFAETQSGLFAVDMLRQSGTDGEGNAFFRFRPGYLEQAVTVIWPQDDAFVLIPEGTAKVLVARKYAKPIDQDMIDRHNAAIEKPARKTKAKAVKAGAGDDLPTKEETVQPDQKEAKNG